MLKNMPVKKTLVASAVGILIALLIMFAGAALISIEILAKGREGVIGTVGLTLGALAASAIAARAYCTGKILAALTTGALILTVLCAYDLFSGGSCVTVSSFIHQFLCVAIGSITGCIVFGSGRRRRRKR